jgi:uncharacterized protein (TIGR03118 family)
MAKRFAALVAAIGLLAVAALPAAARNPNANNSFTVHNLVSDRPGAMFTDGDLVNGWGITASATSPWWVADNGTDKSTLYRGTGVKVPLTVSVAGGPTGTVFNGSSDFVVSSGAASGPALFIFATEDGTIRGWNPGVPAPVPPATTSTQTEVGASSAGAIYKGLAIGAVGSTKYLYAADFHHARIDVFDGSWNPALPGSFVDPGIPAGYAPFGIQALHDMIFVTYAKQDADAEDEIAGPGLGYVSAFAMNGTFLGRVASRGALNAPWGLAWAPAGFGRFSGNLLVGNFGDGRINAYAWTGTSWVARGHLKTANHHPLSIDGLWGIGFGNGATGGSGPVTTLYFAAGPDDESHGLFGSITSP